VELAVKVLRIAALFAFTACAHSQVRGHEQRRWFPPPALPAPHLTPPILSWKANLDWQETSPGDAVASFNVYRAVSSVAAPSNSIAVLIGSTTAQYYVDVFPCPPGSLVEWYAVAVDAHGYESGDSNTFSIRIP
jgi:hypothetical protein